MSELEAGVKKSLVALGNDVVAKLRLYAQLNSFHYGSGLPLPDKLTLRTGRLLRLLLGTGARSRAGSIADVKEIADGVHITWGAESPDIALHELGGVRTITAPMRKFYWAKYFTDPTRKRMWLILALFKSTIRYPARKPIRWAADAAQPEIQNIIEEYLAKIVRVHQQLLVRGTQKAQPLNYYQE